MYQNVYDAGNCSKADITATFARAFRPGMAYIPSALCGDNLTPTKWILYGKGKGGVNGAVHFFCIYVKPQRVKSGDKKSDAVFSYQSIQLMSRNKSGGWRANDIAS